MDSVSFRIAQLEDVENVFNYEFQKIAVDGAHEIENQILVWNSFFRKEALEHYFKLGWSFIAETPDKQIVGFFLGQPLLFVDKQTQSLWVEFISADTAQIATELVDIAYRLSREKHLQRVLFSEDVKSLDLTKEFPFQKWERNTLTLKTTK